MTRDDLVRLFHGPSTSATITPLGASLLDLRLGGTRMVHPVVDASPPWGAAGGVLLPWPNRVADATWQLGGVDQHLEVTEPEQGNALHGFLLRARHRVSELDAAGVTLAAGIEPRPGYPFGLATTVRYLLGHDGLTVTHTVRNDGADPAPVAVGAHPYLCVGDDATEDLELQVAADTRYLRDDRGIPRERVRISGAHDLRDGRRLGSTPRNTTYTDLALVDGRHRHRLVAPSGEGLEMWTDADFGHVQVYTTADVPGGDGAAMALAVEPMTAAPDAFNNHDGLHWIDPGQAWTVRWGIRQYRRPV